jgi:hypothetical protein
MPVDIMDCNIPDPFHRAFESHITIIRACKNPRPRTQIDRLIDDETISRIFYSWTE